MNFLSPAYFWTFTALAPLAAIYFLKVRPRRMPTPAFFLWKKVFQEKRSSALFNRLRDLWSLLLMILVFSAIALALSEPELTQDARRDLLILVDQSASMNAGGRWESAKNEAKRIIKALDGRQRAAVATLATEIKFLSHLTDDPRELLDAVERMKPTDLPLRLEAVATLDLAKTLNTQAGGHRALFLTDGGFDPSAIPADMELIKIGDRLDNVGIVAADLQVLPGADSRLGWQFQLLSSFTAPVEADLTLKRTDSGLIGKLVHVKIQPGLNPPETFILEDAEPGAWRAELELADAFAKDNAAYLVAQKPKPIRVRVEAEDRYFLENSVLAFASGSGLLSLNNENPDLVLAKGASPEAPLAMLFQPKGASPWWSDVGEELEAVAAKVLLKEHPALRFVDASAISFAGARNLRAPEGALVLVASDQGVPLLYQARSGDRAAMVVNMDPVEADFYFSAWFPVLVHGAATYLSGREVDPRATYPTAMHAPAPGARDGESTQVKAPSGLTSEIRGKSYGPLTELGYHELTNKSGAWQLGVSLLNDGESALDNSAVSSTAKAIAKGQSPALLLTLLAILVLVMESILYHRRKVG